MMLAWRFLPALFAIVLLVVKSYSPDFLSQTAVEAVGLSWWGVLFWLSATLAAWLIQPALLGAIASAGRLPAIGLIIVIGVIVFAEIVYNHTLAALWGESHFIRDILEILNGG